MSELRLQQDCFIWHWNAFPAERRMLHHNNNNAQNAIKGAFNKAIGVVAGIADLEYICGGTVVFIELKTPTGSQTEEQKEFQAKVEAQGLRYEIVRSLPHFKALIRELQNEAQTHGHPLNQTRPSVA